MRHALAAFCILGVAGCDLELISPQDGGEGGAQGGAEPVAAGGAGGVATGGAGGEPSSWEWQLPPGFPTPKVPEENPMSAAKVELGRHLFYDTRLSENETQSCASCHLQSLAFTDGLAHAVGSTGEQHPRSSMSLANVGYSVALTWANPILFQLETQASVPIFGTMPVELGMDGKEDELMQRLDAEPIYVTLFADAFPADPQPVSLANLTRALATFERTLVSGRSAFDRFTYDGDASALSDSAKRGLDLFNSEKLECFHCHVGFNFQDSVTFEGQAFPQLKFHNTGLYNIGGNGAYPPGGEGLYAMTGVPEDMGRFRVPTLRNITVTAPYMHDGSAATLDDVIDHYAAAGRTIESGPNAGVGADNPFKSNFIIGFTLTPSERADLHAFFESLTDEEFLTNPAFADPRSQ